MMRRNSSYILTQLVTSISIDKSTTDKLVEIINKKLSTHLTDLSVELVYPLLLKDVDTGMANDKLVMSYLVQASSESIDPVIGEVANYLSELVDKYLKNKGLIFKLSKVNYTKL